MHRHQITARLTPEQFRMLRRLADRYGRSINRETTLAVEKHLLEGTVAMMATGELAIEETLDGASEFTDKVEKALDDARARSWNRPVIDEVAERLAA